MLYKLGLIYVILVIMISIDDLIWDIFYFLNKLRGKYKKEKIYFEDLETVPPKMLAVLVAAYHEENVIEQVIDNMIRSNHYPDSMYHVFIGVYPNDPETQEKVDKLSQKYPNVHKIIHVLEGPSSKADNLNNLIDKIYSFEEENYIRFAALVIHDSEDLVHPYEFKLDNYLLEKYPAIQIPVFPLKKNRGFKYLIPNTIAGTYSDEFAENHYRILVARTVTNAFVPSAGTGFVIRRDVLDAFDDPDIFPVGSLTEDYKLSLEISQKGFPVHYVLEDIYRILPNKAVKKEFISTRSMFPSSYGAAVKQKTRWIYGITMESFRLKDILFNKNLNLQSKYSLYRDWKAKFGNLLLGPGYLIFLYFILSYFFKLETIFPKHSLSWYLMIFLSIMMIERQLLRFRAVKGVYGRREAIISSFLPPLLPIRMVVGNIINFHATVDAWINRFFSRKKKTKKARWSKTDHDFLEEEVLKTHRMSLADILLNRGFIEEDSLKKALEDSRARGESLESYLYNREIVDQDLLVRAICEKDGKEYLKIKPRRYLSYFISMYGREKFKSLKAIPLIRLGEKLIVVITLETDREELTKFFKDYDLEYIYTSKRNLIEALDEEEFDYEMDEKILVVERYIRAGYIDAIQGSIAINYNRKEETIESTLARMGLLIDIEKENRG